MVTVALTVNGVRHEISAPPDATLLWILRDQLKLTGTRYGCGKGECGACTVHLDGKPALSCQYVPADVGARAVTTIEGLSPTGTHAMQQAWIAARMPSCDYCRSGQIMRAAGLLNTIPKPTREQIAEAMKPNVCRCGAGSRFLAAIEQAAGG